MCWLERTWINAAEARSREKDDTMFPVCLLYVWDVHPTPPNGQYSFGLYFDGNTHLAYILMANTHLANTRLAHI